MPKSKRKNSDDEKFEAPLDSATDKKQKTETLGEALDRCKAGDALGWMKDGQLISVNSGYSLNSVLSVLYENNILSVPVYDEEKKSFIGFIDMIDIACATVDVEEQTGLLPKLEAEDKEHPKTTEEKTKDVEKEEVDAEELEERFIMANLSAKAISDISHRDPFVHVNVDDSVLKVAQLLIYNHRVGVMEDGTLKGVITQSGLTEYMSEEHAEVFDKVTGEATLGDLNVPKEIYSIDENERAIEAFKMLRDKGVSGLAVTRDGKFVDTISSSDIMVWAEWILCGQTMRFTNLANLRKPIKHFLTESRTQRFLDKKRYLAVELTTNLQEVINDMQVNNVHRLFVVEGDKPKSVVNYSHILEYLSQH